MIKIKDLSLVHYYNTIEESWYTWNCNYLLIVQRSESRKQNSRTWGSKFSDMWEIRIMWILKNDFFVRSLYHCECVRIDKNWTAVQKVILESKEVLVTQSSNPSCGWLHPRSKSHSLRHDKANTRARENWRQKWEVMRVDESYMCHASEELSGCPLVTRLISESLDTRGKEHRPNPGHLQSSDMWFNADGVLLD